MWKVNICDARYSTTDASDEVKEEARVTHLEWRDLKLQINVCQVEKWYANVAFEGEDDGGQIGHLRGR
jgi:hypothetical protein